MSKPTIRQVNLGDGKGLVWEIECGGIIRRHSQQWQAEWLYNYLTRLYNCDETSPQ